jgi:hypothetical protein
MVGPRPEGTTAVVWLLFAVVVVVPYVHWVHALEPGKPVNPYTVFPLLGVWAWSLMWTHYVHGTLTMVSSRFTSSATYKRWTGWMVLTLVLAHPGLLMGALLVDTEQVPPASYLGYAGAGREWLAVLGTVALVAFLGYEALVRLSLRERLGAGWRWVSVAQMVAMTAVFVHGLGLGRHLEQPGWFRHYWVLLGALLLPCFAVIGRADWRSTAPGRAEAGG